MLSAMISPTSSTFVSASTSAASRLASVQKCCASDNAVASPTCLHPSAKMKRANVVCFAFPMLSSRFEAAFGPMRLTGFARSFVAVVGAMKILKARA